MNYDSAIKEIRGLAKEYREEFPLVSIVLYALTGSMEVGTTGRLATAALLFVEGDLIKMRSFLLQHGCEVEGQVQMKQEKDDGS